MMKLVIAGVVAFLVSLGGTTGVFVMRAKPVPAAESTAAAQGNEPSPAGDSTVGDSTAASHAPAAAPAVAAPSLPRAGVTQAPAPGTATASESLGEAAAVQADSATKRPVADAPRDMSDAYRQLARIFSNMKTADAAKVLAHMSDDEVQGVIEQLGVRQAASLLAALPKDRAAALSRRLLHDPADHGAKR